MFLSGKSSDAKFWTQIGWLGFGAGAEEVHWGVVKDEILLFENTNLESVLISYEAYEYFLRVLILKISWRSGFVTDELSGAVPIVRWRMLCVILN